MTSKPVTFKAGNDTGTGYLAAGVRGPAVLVLNAWWGLNDFFKSFSDRLAREEFVVLAPDLNQGAGASTVDQAKDLMSKRKFSVVSGLVTGAHDYLRALPSVSSPRTGVVGFSMDGAFGMWLASQRPDDVAAVVSFYGIEEVDLEKVRAAFLGHYADPDEWEPFENVRRD